MQEYAGGRLAVLGLGLPAVVGVQSASSPPRYVSMARLRQAMTEASTETLQRQRRGTERGAEARFARPAEPQTGATMLEGDAEQVAAQIVAVLRERGSSGELMGDVLVYLDPSMQRPAPGVRATARRRDRRRRWWRVTRSGEPTDGDRLTAADVVLEVSHPALAPYLPEAHQAVLAAAIKARTPDLVLFENTTAGHDLAAAAAAAAGLPFVGYCLELSLDGGEAQAISAIYGGQLARHRAHVAAGGVRGQFGGPARGAADRRAGASASRSRRPPSWTICGRRSSRRWRRLTRAWT